MLRLCEFMVHYEMVSNMPIEESTPDWTPSPISRTASSAISSSASTDARAASSSSSIATNSQSDDIEKAHAISQANEFEVFSLAYAKAFPEFVSLSDGVHHWLSRKFETSHGYTLASALEKSDLTPEKFVNSPIEGRGLTDFVLKEVIQDYGAISGAVSLYRGQPLKDDSDEYQQLSAGLHFWNEDAISKGQPEFSPDQYVAYRSFEDAYAKQAALVASEAGHNSIVVEQLTIPQFKWLHREFHKQFEKEIADGKSTHTGIDLDRFIHDQLSDEYRKIQAVYQSNRSVIWGMVAPFGLDRYQEYSSVFHEADETRRLTQPNSAPMSISSLVNERLTPELLAQRDDAEKAYEQLKQKRDDVARQQAESPSSYRDPLARLQAYEGKKREHDEFRSKVDELEYELQGWKEVVENFRKKYLTNNSSLNASLRNNDAFLTELAFFSDVIAAQQASGSKKNLQSNVRAVTALNLGRQAKAVLEDFEKTVLVPMEQKFTEKDLLLRSPSMRLMMEDMELDKLENSLGPRSTWEERYQEEMLPHEIKKTGVEEEIHKQKAILDSLQDWVRTGIKPQDTARTEIKPEAPEQFRQATLRHKSSSTYSTQSEQSEEPSDLTDIFKPLSKTGTFDIEEKTLDRLNKNGSSIETNIDSRKSSIWTKARDRVTGPMKRLGAYKPKPSQKIKDAIADQLQGKFVSPTPLPKPPRDDTVWSIRVAPFYHQDNVTLLEIVGASGEHFDPPQIHTVKDKELHKRTGCTVDKMDGLVKDYKDKKQLVTIRVRGLDKKADKHEKAAEQSKAMGGKVSKRSSLKK